MYKPDVLPQEEEYREISTQLPKIRTSDMVNLLFCKLLPYDMLDIEKINFYSCILAYQAKF